MLNSYFSSKRRGSVDAKQWISRRFTCTLLALFRKCLQINGAGEGNRTLVIIQRLEINATPSDSELYTVDSNDGVTI
jgi:hypothetical protein